MTSVLYSGRLDVVGNEEETVAKFREFLVFGGIKQYILSREDKEKDGVTPTKVHFHFLIISTKSHDSMRREMTKLGWKGPLGSLSIAVAPPKRTLEKSLHYVLKQQNIIISDWENIEQLKEQAKEYNEEIVLKPCFDHHFKEFIMPEMSKRNLSFRGDMLMYMIEYVTKYNQNDKGAEMALPTTTSTMLRYLQKYEMKQFPNDCTHSILQDYRGIAGFSETKESTMNKELYEIRQRRKHQRDQYKTANPFQDSDAEDSVI